jgi:chromosomal replication initiator protein
MPSTPPDHDLELIWGRVQEELRRSVPATTYRLWLEPLHVVSAQGSTIYLRAPANVQAWVERRYLARLVSVLRRQTTALTDVRFVGDSIPADVAVSAPPEPEVNPAHTFDAFVIGPGNRLAHAAALAVAELPGDAYNPLFLHGPPGLGKTHLLDAIYHYLRENHPGLSVRHTTAERFTAEFVGALRAEGPDGFKRRYRELDALLIDDLQVLEGKQRTEEEFVHTFNALFAAGKQIVLSSDRPPAALERLAERLRDRLDWGLSIELEPPDLRTRIAVHWRMASRNAAEFDDPAVLRQIADHVPSNVRLLEGAMTRVQALSSILSEPISEPLIGKALMRGEGAPPLLRKGETSIRAIQDTVAQAAGVSREELLSPSRIPKIAKARQLAMYLARDLTSLSLAQIAREFNRDHSTVLHAIRSVSGRLEPGSETSTAINRIRASLGTMASPDAGGEDSLHEAKGSPQDESTPERGE